MTLTHITLFEPYLNLHTHSPCSCGWRPSTTIVCTFFSDLFYYFNTLVMPNDINRDVGMCCLP